MALHEFAISMSRLPSFLGYHHIIMTFCVGIIILQAILVAGCSSYGTMRSVYPLSISYRNITGDEGFSSIAQNLSSTFAFLKGSTAMEVRVGYFGICAKQAGRIWVCWEDAEGIRDQIGAENDPLNLLDVAASFKDDVLFSGLIFMAIVLSLLTLFLLATFPGWRTERDATTGSDYDVKPFPSKPVSQTALAFIFVAAVLSLISALWQHIGAVGAAAMAEKIGYGNIRTSVGAAAMILGWASMILAMLAMIALLVMIISIAVLDRLTD